MYNFLDENKSLILKIVESQNSGRVNECAEYRGRLQQNLMYLAAIADSQPQPPTMHSPFATVGMTSAHYMQPEQAQQLSQQTLMAARSSMLYSQQAYSSLQQQQALHSQLGMSSGGSGLNILQSEGHAGGSAALRNTSSPGFWGLGTSGEGLHSSGNKQETEGSSSGAYDGQTHYSKTASDGN
ncbi:hypothetical protein Leryth_008279 [Lithospermum erythrorhizon]|nr:hypothetical protein Leryth_008279 [Lithospermum erythrorhizon]